MYSAFAFSICALIAVAYSSGMFLFRALALKRVRLLLLSLLSPCYARLLTFPGCRLIPLQRHSVRYHDPIGPSVLGAVVTAALLANFVLRYREL